MEATEASRVEEFVRIRDKNVELKGKLRDSQASLEALANDNAALTTKVAVLEAKAQAAEECVAQKEFARYTFTLEAVEQVVEKFK